MINPIELPDLKARHVPGQRLFGLDLGSKTIGMALSDGMLSIASPYMTIQRTKFTTDIAELARHAHKHGVYGLIVGLPLNMDGSEGPRVQSVRTFIRNLAGKHQGGLVDGLRILVDIIDQANFLSPLCGNIPAGVGQFRHMAGCHYPGQALQRTHIGNNTDLRFTHTKQGVFGRQPDITGRCKINSCTQAMGVNRRNHRHRAVGDQPQQGHIFLVQRRLEINGHIDSRGGSDRGRVTAACARRIYRPTADMGEVDHATSDERGRTVREHVAQLHAHVSVVAI